MATLVLFGGGDAGGFYIGADGRIHRIPPYDPNLRAELAAVSRLVRVSGQLADEGLRTEVKAVTERLASAVIPVAVKTVGLQGNASLSVAFLSDGDDFVCGSTGRIIPVPIPRGLGQIAAAAATAQ